MKPLNEFPEPLVEPLPVSVGVYFAPEFVSFTHKEKRPGPAGEEWTINLGTPQLQVFRAIFDATFTAARELDAPERGNGRVDDWRGGAGRSVSSRRSSNRTCGFPASGSLWNVMPSPTGSRVSGAPGR
jgi:hypothetical protein